MPPTSVSLDYLMRLYYETKLLTNNFSEINSTILVENPQRILVLRLALEMSQNQFEKLIGMESKNTSKYERGIIKSMKENTAKKYLEKITSELKQKQISEIKIVKNYERMLKESNGYIKAHQGTRKILLAQRKGAINSLRNRGTKQEILVSSILFKNNIQNEINYPLDNKRAIITDIFIKKFNIAIECKDLKTENYMEHKRQIQKLAYQGYRIKFYFPTIKLIALINSKFKLSERDFDELKGPYNHILTDVESVISDISFS